jgi:N-acetyl-anhydromuramyl-L-alanine amidase AmpD
MTYPIDTTHPSPNHSSRNGSAIKLLVLHATVGGLHSSLTWLTSPASKVSTHYLISKAGIIYQLVPDMLAAWHAGRARWHGVTAINNCSLGIELENDNTGHDPYPPQQLAAAHWLCQEKIARYNIERADVVRHLDIAVPQGRKTDPAGLPWPAFADSLYMDSPPVVGTHYQVLRRATAGAVIRSGPRQNAARLGSLPPGAAWTGVAVPGQQLYVLGVGSSNLWVRDSQARFVWAGLLDEVT